MSTVPKAEQNERVRVVYCDLMEEIKRRYGLVGRAVAGELDLDMRSAEEFSMFHLRMICELIAIGCLVVHGDIRGTESGKIVDAYQADIIIKMLGRLHQDFYPRPGEQITTEFGLEVVDITSDFLTKQQLGSLYHKAGDILHIGTIKTFPSKWNRSINMEAISVWGKKILRLLNHHRITLSDGKTELWTMMQSSPDGKVRTSIFKQVYGPIA